MFGLDEAYKQSVEDMNAALGGDDFREGVRALRQNRKPNFLSPDGSMRCVLTDPSAEEFAWAPDGRRVAFHSRRDGQWGIYVYGGE